MARYSPSAKNPASGLVGALAPKTRTLLDLAEPSFDAPGWQPRGTKCHNGIRMRVESSIRL